MSRKYYGPTVNVNIDGEGQGNDGVDVSCCLSMGEHHLCPFAGGYMMEGGRLMEGQACHFRDGFTCRKVAARLASLERAKRLVAKTIRETEDELE